MRRTLAIGLPIVIFCSFLIATAGAAIAPSIQKWASPFLCQKPYGTMVVSSDTGKYTPNLSVQTFTVGCVDAHRNFKEVNSLADSGVVFLETSVVLSLLLALVTSLILVGRHIGKAKRTTMTTQVT